MSRLTRSALPALVCGLVLAAAAPALAKNAKEASIVSKQALDYYKQGRFKFATELYRRAYKLDSSRPEYLYGAARSEHKAGRLESARTLYELVLTLMDPNTPAVARARAYLAEIKAASGKTSKPAAKPGPTPKPSPVAKPSPAAKPRPAAKPSVVKPVRRTKPKGARKPTATKKPQPSATSNGSSTLPMILLGGGGLVVVGAGIVLAMASSDHAALNEKLDGHTSANPVKDISYEDALAERRAANDKIMMGWGLAGIGAIAAGAGAWLLMDGGDKPNKSAWMVAPTGRGAVVSLRF